MKKETSLAFTGDIGFDKYMDKKWKDDALISEGILSFLRSSDHVIANVEGPLYYRESKGNETGAASLIHSMSPEVGVFLKKIGADIWNICNNHIMDAGPEGINATIEKAKELGVKTLGAGMNIKEAMEPVIINEAGGIGLIGVGYQRACRKAGEDTPGCFSWSELDAIGNAISDIKKNNRWCIVVAHAGEEFTSLPSPYTRERYHMYLDMGADAVVAHHPHVPMNYETVGDKVIFYSLGNFIFDTDYQRSQLNTEKGIVVKLNFSEDEFSFDYIGININREKECVEEGDIPLIFRDVNEEDYNLLLPLSCKAFLANTKKQQIYLKPDKYSAGTTEEEWKENFYEPLRSGRVPGETLDLQIIYPIALMAEDNQWQKSSNEDVKKYILEQIGDEKQI